MVTGLEDDYGHLMAVYGAKTFLTFFQIIERASHHFVFYPMTITCRNKESECETPVARDECLCVTPDSTTLPTLECEPPHCRAFPSPQDNLWTWMQKAHFWSHAYPSLESGEIP